MDEEWLRLFSGVYGVDLQIRFMLSADERDIRGIGKNYGLSEQESLAVYAYTLGEWYKPEPFKLVNACLRNKKICGDFEKSLAATLGRALRKLPVVRGISYRRCTIPLGVRERILREAPTTDYVDAAFLSTSEEVVDTISGDDAFLIIGRTGRNVAPLSAFPDEKEVLFMPSTRFLITQAEEIGGGLAIEMEEE